MSKNLTEHLTEEKSTTAIAVALDLGTYDVQTSLDELKELAQTAGVEIVATIVQKRSSPENATYVGTGMLEEIVAQSAALEVDMIIFDSELSPAQLRNIEKAAELEIVDRTTLILSIFAARAATSEGRLQVELAQQRYRLPRLMGRGTSMSRLGAGSSLSNRGPGETKLESDRRHLRGRITALEKELAALQKRRQFGRERRKKDNVTTIAIVGYTNVGKSSLLGLITNQPEELGENKLFATLDLTMRQAKLPDGREIVFTDTVGFIRRLPHHLVEAFKSTLEEAVNADLILNVCDAASGEAREQLEVTSAILSDLGAGDIPMITVFNKCDKLEEIPATIGDNTVFMSAKTGYGQDKLLELIVKNLPPSRRNLQLLIPFDKGSLTADIRSNGEILSEEYTTDGTLINAWVDEKILHKVEAYITEN